MTHVGPDLSSSRNSYWETWNFVCQVACPQCDSPRGMRCTAISGWCRNPHDARIKLASETPSNELRDGERVGWTAPHASDARSIDGERWLPVAGYECLYEVSDHGRVRSLRRWRGVAGRILSPTIKPDGHLYVALSANGTAAGFLVHCLVATAFLGPRPTGQQVRHGPGGAADNRVVNLCYGTAGDNNGPDRVRDGTSNHGERNGSSKLAAADVREIRRRCADGEPQAAVAGAYEMHPSAISLLVSGKTWGHIL